MWRFTNFIYVWYIKFTYYNSEKIDKNYFKRKDAMDMLKLWL